MKRTFIPGEEWLYYKIYVGKRSANMVLTDIVLPLSNALLTEGHIDKWFFIRYADPDFHLRIRLHLSDMEKLGLVISSMHQAMATFIAEGIIYKVQIDTYQRELERYGGESIALAESYFMHDSILVAGAIDLIEDENLFALYIVKTIDRLLDDFNISLDEKLDIAQKGADGFKTEFNANKHLNKQLAQKYRDHREQLRQLMQSIPEESELFPLEQLVRQRSEKMSFVAKDILQLHKNGKLSLALHDLLWSFIHMSVNRAFKNKQRLHEMVCYDMLLRYYQMEIGKEKVKSRKSRI
ncbi:thiopeptide-type bacteriocin biosynthesis protein [Sungkyunkwania multivorans]|uniref:Thiopeptide-type bacteriocin biosynthesis protein n=1 Tax=Sungkyunkwania multivorans TaxID=1173618 RepID=A0ABW3D1C8_9FLAO